MSRAFSIRYFMWSGVIVCLACAVSSCSSSTDPIPSSSTDAGVDAVEDHDDASDGSTTCDPSCPGASVTIGDECSDYPDGKVCVRDDSGNCPIVGTPTPMICRTVDGGKVWQFPLAT